MNLAGYRRNSARVVALLTTFIGVTIGCSKSEAPTASPQLDRGAGGRRTKVENGNPAHIRAAVVPDGQRQPSRNGKAVATENAEPFVFFHGEYIALPYDVTVRGASLFVGKHLVFEHAPAPTVGGRIVYQEKLPPLPEGIDAESAWADVDKVTIDGRSWKERFTLYFGSHYPPSEARDRLRDAVEKLPFIKEATIVSAPQFGADAEYVRAVSKSGDVREFYTSWWDPKNRGGFDSVSKPFDARMYTPDQIAKDMQESADRIRPRIDRGDILVFSSKHGNYFVVREQSPKRWEQIVNVIRILNSDINRDQKISEILARLYNDPPVKRKGATWFQVSEIVDNYRPSDEINSRMRQLESKISIPLWAPDQTTPEEP